MQKHIIHKQKVELEIPAQKDAFNYQDTVSRLFNNGLLTAIEDVLDGMALQDEVIRIDALKLNLGSINAVHFEKEFKEKLVSCLKAAVISGKATTGGETNTVVTKPAASQRDAFVHFVLHGVLPWYSQVKNMQVWEEELFEKWQMADWQFIAQWVKEKAIQQAEILQRIVLQFSQHFLATLAENIRALTSNAEAVDAGTWKLWHKDVVYIAGKATEQNTEGLAMAIWHNIFMLLLMDDRVAVKYSVVTKLIVKQLLTNPAVAEANVVKYKKQLLKHAEGGTVHNVLYNIITAVENKQPLSSITEYLLHGSIDALFNNSSINKAPGDNTVAAPFGIGNNLTAESKPFDISNNLAAESKPQATIQQNEAAGAIIVKPAMPIADKISNKGNSTQTAEDVLYINNSGLVLLHPFLGAYFSDLGLLKNKQFLHVQAQQRGVLLLYYLATGQTEAPEFNLVLQKVLCGYGVEETLPATIELSEKEKEESSQLLRTVIDYWPPLKNTSIDGFRQTFLQREGRLSTIQSGWLLRVEQKAVDILLGKLPWCFSTIRLPWMKNMMNVEWA